MAPLWQPQGKLRGALHEITKHADFAFVAARAGSGLIGAHVYSYSQGETGVHIRRGRIRLGRKHQALS